MEPGARSAAIWRRRCLCVAGAFFWGGGGAVGEYFTECCLCGRTPSSSSTLRLVSPSVLPLSSLPLSPTLLLRSIPPLPSSLSLLSSLDLPPSPPSSPSFLPLLFFPPPLHRPPLFSPFFLALLPPFFSSSFLLSLSSLSYGSLYPKRHLTKSS